ncbi:MAG: acyltransferase, partial [Myxococcales bacterium]
HNLVPETIWTMNGAYWSLALEAQLYLVFPLLVALGRRLGPWAIGAVGLGVSAVWPLVVEVLHATPPRGELYGVWYESLPGRLGEFAAGMVAAALVAEGRSSAWPRWPLAALALLWAPASHAVSVARLIDYPLDKLANAVSFGSLVVLCAGLPAAWWRWAPLRALGFIGLMAYSLYLVHQPALLLWRIPVWEIPLSQHRAALPFLLAGGVALSLAVGLAFYLLVERPIERARR